MNVNFKLLPEAVASVRPASKQEALECVAQTFADVYGIDRDEVIEGLEEREHLGSTGFGGGVAIPHARSTLVRRPTTVLLRLEAPVDFDAADRMPVTIVFGLLSPENAGATHLHALAAISRFVRDEATHQALSETSDPEALYSLLSNQLELDAA
jgi:PTS system nitrogen regulatory IIA component